MSETRLDGQISSLEAHIELLKHERRKLTRQMVENRQHTAECVNMIRRLKARKKVTE